VVVMNRGRIEQIGTPNDLYHAPMTRFVAGFIGSPAMNFLPCRLEEPGGALCVRLSDDIVLPVPHSRAGRYRSHAGRAGLTFGLRPEHLTDGKPNGAPQPATIDAAIEVTEPLGMETLVFFRVNGIDVCGRVSPNAGAREGGRMRLAASLVNMHPSDDATGCVLAGGKPKNGARRRFNSTRAITRAGLPYSPRSLRLTPPPSWHVRLFCRTCRRRAATNRSTGLTIVRHTGRSIERCPL